MANVQIRIDQRAACTNPQAADLLVAATDVGNTNAVKSLSVGDLLTNSSSNVAIAQYTPSSSSDSGPSVGLIFYDSDYLYVTVSPGNIKRVALESF